MLLLDMCRALRCLDEAGEPVQTEGGIFVNITVSFFASQLQLQAGPRLVTLVLPASYYPLLNQATICTS